MFIADQIYDELNLEFFKGLREMLYREILDNLETEINQEVANHMMDLERAYLAS